MYWQGAAKSLARRQGPGCRPGDHGLRRARAGPYLHQRKCIFAVSVVVLGFGFDREQVIPVYIRQASSFLRSILSKLPPSACQASVGVPLFLYQGSLDRQSSCAQRDMSGTGEIVVRGICRGQASGQVESGQIADLAVGIQWRQRHLQHAAARDGNNHPQPEKSVVLDTVQCLVITSRVSMPQPFVKEVRFAHERYINRVVAKELRWLPISATKAGATGYPSHWLPISATNAGATGYPSHRAGAACYTSHCHS